MARLISFTKEVYSLYGLFVNDVRGFRWMTTDEKAAQLKAARLASVRIIAHDFVLDHAGAVSHRVAH